VTDAVPTPTPHVLVVTSAGASAAVVVPVLAALEAGGMRVRAIDIGAAGGGGAGMADRVRRALLGETAERRLEKELRTTPPDVAIAFDPHSTQALTVARDQVGTPAPVIGVVGELEPAREWAESAADRFCAIDPECAVALADAGIEDDRILVVGPIGPRAWADAAREDTAALRARFKIGGAVALVEVAGLGAELTSQLVMQLSLTGAGDTTTFLFDAGSDVDAAATLRAKVPMLGLKGKLFGATADAPLLWRCADVAVLRPHPESIAKAVLVGARIVALVDDEVAGAARIAAALELRRLGVAARSPLLIAAALEQALKVRPGSPQPDGAETVADVAWIVAGDKRAVVEERRAAERAAAHAKVRAATSAAQAAARVAAVPGELEDLGGGDDGVAAENAPDPAELARLVAEAQARKKEMERAMMQAQQSGDQAQMHTLLAELAQLETELRELERAVAAARQAGPAAGAARTRAAAPPPRSASGGSAERSPGASVDDLLEQMKRGGGARPSDAAPKPPPARSGTTVDDELAALKRKMEQTKTSPKKGS